MPLDVLPWAILFGGSALVAFVVALGWAMSWYPKRRKPRFDKSSDLGARRET